MILTMHKTVSGRTLGFPGDIAIAGGRKEKHP